ncbi:MAG: inositol monophosphatase family protein [Chitinispirillaceae bacterium]
MLKTAIEAARKAGLMLKENFGTTLDVEHKPDQSLVTNIDKEAERIILDRIKSVYPSHSVLAEESGKEAGDDYTWIIDPLDGTHNYVRGNVMYGVCIGLARREEFVAGVIYLPAFEEMYAAEKGQGAFKNDEPIRVSATTELSQSTLLFDSGLHEGGDYKLEVFKRISGSVFNVRMLGASSRNLSYLAEGKADLIVEFDEKPWDFLAGTVLIREAGGVVSGFDGEPLAVESKRYIAGNGILNLQMREEVNRALGEIGEK